jgi:ribosomal protein S18 acetylase RimI-like enzyme
VTEVETLRRMQAVTAETWRLESSHAPFHVGDLAWMRYQHRGRENEWRTRLWERDGEDVAWGWLRLLAPQATLFSCIRPDVRAELAAEVLEWAEGEASGAPLAVETQSRDAIGLRVLEERGYGVDPAARALAVHHRRLDAAAPVQAPDGFRLRTVERDDLAARVELHRVVWAPSRVTEESYRDVQAAWPYRASLDCVLESPDGRLVAYCLAWLDESNGVGEFEPVGTHPDFRRRGLGAAVCRFALRRLREEGATQAVVYGDLDPANGGPKALYESIGFVETSRLLRFAVPTGPLRPGPGV